jgi:hypothetical protein
MTEWESAKQAAVGHAGLTAWRLFDGNIMCGKIVGDGIGRRNVDIERIDGSLVTCCLDRCRAGTYDDLLAAVRFFQVRDLGI